MRRRARGLLVLSVLIACLGPGSDGAVATQGRRVDLVVSNGHYCRQDPCRFVFDTAYRRTPDGPVSGTDNPAMIVEVAPGDTVVWTYRDTGACDPFANVPFVDCKGHEVRFENGTPTGAEPVGFMPAKSGPVSISWRVPAGARPGTLLRYFCSIDSDTVNGIPYPAGTGVLTVHYLYGTTGILKVV